MTAPTTGAAEVPTDYLYEIGRFVGIPGDRMQRFLAALRVLGAEIRFAAPKARGAVFAQWDDEGEAECFRRIKEAVGDPPCNAKHAAQYACEIVGQWLRGTQEQAISVEARSQSRVVGGESDPRAGGPPATPPAPAEETP